MLASIGSVLGSATVGTFQFMGSLAGTAPKRDPIARSMPQLGCSVYNLAILILGNTQATTTVLMPRFEGTMSNIGQVTPQLILESLVNEIAFSIERCAEFSELIDRSHPPIDSIESRENCWQTVIAGSEYCLPENALRIKALSKKVNKLLDRLESILCPSLLFNYALGISGALPRSFGELLTTLQKNDVISAEWTAKDYSILELIEDKLCATLFKHCNHVLELWDLLPPNRLQNNQILIGNVEGRSIIIGVPDALNAHIYAGMKTVKAQQILATARIDNLVFINIHGEEPEFAEQRASFKNLEELIRTVVYEAIQLPFVITYRNFEETCRLLQITLNTNSEEIRLRMTGDNLHPHLFAAIQALLIGAILYTGIPGTRILSLIIAAYCTPAINSSFYIIKLFNDKVMSPTARYFVCGTAYQFTGVSAEQFAARFAHNIVRIVTNPALPFIVLRCLDKVCDTLVRTRAHTLNPTIPLRNPQAPFADDPESFYGHLGRVIVSLGSFATPAQNPPYPLTIFFWLSKKVIALTYNVLGSERGGNLIAGATHRLTTRLFRSNRHGALLGLKLTKWVELNRIIGQEYRQGHTSLAITHAACTYMYRQAADLGFVDSDLTHYERAGLNWDQWVHQTIFALGRIAFGTFEEDLNAAPDASFRDKHFRVRNHITEAYSNQQINAELVRNGYTLQDGEIADGIASPFTEAQTAYNRITVLEGEINQINGQITSLEATRDTLIQKQPEPSDPQQGTWETFWKAADVVRSQASVAIYGYDSRHIVDNDQLDRIYNNISEQQQARAPRIAEYQSLHSENTVKILNHDPVKLVNRTLFEYINLKFGSNPQLHGKAIAELERRNPPTLAIEAAPLVQQAIAIDELEREANLN